MISQAFECALRGEEMAPWPLRKNSISRENNVMESDGEEVKYVYAKYDMSIVELCKG
jgi:hypothetical protein